MSGTESSKIKDDPTEPVKPRSKKDYGIIDMMLSHGELRVIDSETLIKETQNRVWHALKSGYEYSPVEDESDAFCGSMSRLE